MFRSFACALPDRTSRASGCHPGRLRATLRETTGAQRCALRIAGRSAGATIQWAARTPLVLVVAGVSASGKTTLARALAEDSGYAHVSSDVVRKRLAGFAPTHRAPPALYGADANRATYAALGRRAAEAAKAGVIVDATFRNRVDRDAFREQLGASTPLLAVECRVPAAVLLARACARLRDAERISDAGPDVVRVQLQSSGRLDELGGRDHLLVRADRTSEALVGAIGDALDRRLFDG
jgi:uncharacterized protein